VFVEEEVDAIGVLFSAGKEGQFKFTSKNK